MTPIAAILAGGKSTRMGSDKAALLWRGETLLAHTAQICLAAGLETLVVGRESAPEWPLQNIIFLPDLTPDHGPLGGLIAALRRSSPAPILALACDMPLLSTTAVQWLTGYSGKLDAESYGLGVRGSDGRIQPLFSLYTSNALPLMEARLSQGRRSVTGVIDAGRFTIVEAPEWIEAQLRNINTPEDLQALRQERS